MLIKAYGEYWARDGIFAREREILGRRKHRRNEPCNVWKQRGIYALYENFKIVYVGQTDGRDIGKRLAEHCKDRLKDRWNSFSWFGVLAFGERGTPLSYVATKSEQSEAIRSLELLAILMSGAPLNRQQGKLPQAEKIWQFKKKTLAVNEERDIGLNKKLDEVLKSLRAIEGLHSKNSR